MTVNAPPTVTIAASGPHVARKGGQSVYQAKGVRDFRPRHVQPLPDADTKVDNTAITAYY